MTDVDYRANSFHNVMTALSMAGALAALLAFAVFDGSYIAAAAIPLVAYSLVKLKDDDEHIEALYLKVAALEWEYAMLGGRA